MFVARNWYGVPLAVIASLFCVAAGLLMGDAAVSGVGLIAAFVFLYRWWRNFARPQAHAETKQISRPGTPAAAAVLSTGGTNPSDVTQLVDQMLSQGRSALLLRPQIIKNLSPEQFERTRDAFEEQAALVPQGEVTVGLSNESFGSGREADDLDGLGRVYSVEAYYLDRYPVTNEQYLKFVQAGGYEEMSIWDPEIWPAVLDLVDLTGHPGPRFWRDGSYEAGTDQHPVVGVSWYEASAYARWCGKRLPSDPEWEKAAAWPMQLSASARPQRKYPWGDSMDPARCNVWGSGPGRIVPVDEFPDGTSVGGIWQMVGNVWEWTQAEFGAAGHPSDDLKLHAPMRGLRGGAFDTYFDNQASCRFQSGDDSLARKHNVSFRCALGASDVAIGFGGEQFTADSEELDDALVGEVSA